MNFYSFNVFHLILKDFNVFGEKKTNLGLFFLQSYLNVKFYCTGVDIFCVSHFLKNLKITLI